MDQTLTTEFQNKTSIEKNSEFEKNLLFFIPKNTTIFTKEMVRQLAMEQREIRKELERYDSWFNTIYFLRSVKKALSVAKRKFFKLFLGVFL